MSELYLQENSFDWFDFLMPYQQAADEIALKLRRIQQQAEKLGEYSPIHHIQTRVKSPDSIMEKARKTEIPLSEVGLRIRDIAGIRIITQFEEDISQLWSMIETRSDMRIAAVKDYMQNPKASGYKSVHLIISSSNTM